jgi:hypothetical protein
MALSLATEQRLLRAGLVQLFIDHEVEWTAAAQTAYNYVEGSFPLGATIRHDDVAKALAPVFEVSATLRNYLSAGKLTQKYWVKDFADLVIDRTWAQIS